MNATASTNNSVTATDLERWLDATLQPAKFKDYAPNGLQVEGQPDICHIVTGVTASQALIQHAIHCGADTILVHHGWFWKNESPCVRGPKRERMALMLRHNINLFGYHLPLDAHPTLGNNAQLAQVLGFSPDTDQDGTPVTFGPGGLVWAGQCAPQTLDTLAADIGARLDRPALAIGSGPQTIRRVAWCTGGAQGMMQDAIDHGVDAYITGEASEQNFHMAHETGTAFIAAGHHATERYGVRALGQEIARTFGIRVDFVDLDNPI